MRQVYIISVGQTPVAEHWNQTAQDLAAHAFTNAIGDISSDRVGALFVANAFGGVLQLQSHIAPSIASTLGLSGIEAYTVEAGGASGGVALRQAYLAIASGAYDCVAVVGVEKLTDVADEQLIAGMALAGDAEWEALHGITLTSQWAMLMRRYMHEYGYTPTDFAPFPVNAHANGVSNAHALYRFPIKPEKVANGVPVADPLGLLDCATMADGAAVLILASEGLARELPHQSVRIAGSAVATDTLALHHRTDPLSLTAATRSSTRAFQQAEVTQGDVNVLELTDPHGIAATLALEANGFAERGVGVQLACEGAITPQGSVPLATGGGYKARGDVGGASGVYQIVELVHQLRGEAGTVQVPQAQIGLAQCLGSIGSTAATHILIAE
ncbi:MAG: acetyl-CoA acetyltransferase [Chloroflexi bacterium AL-W]|nr:acetyl-CoA acetyltransferase [Chloroflexi bacterium AL-N1]NOK65052.1 acetyl-CoA acetyltransferase [Chloroflexi bacterium AL-N10]NOK72681.1 acetyl-CoA acetyltransferase [Chloroflexi bacterium AL-N5]NOK79231.1 acetyl-CoA acetyltransferase [Chloroflexi bacterium AL-W]NOK87147.1 acetyl-CoA acetyltransferase [Chloroflexi bacterium AL-N15]